MATLRFVFVSSVYLIYLPYLLLRKGTEIALKAIFIGCIILVLFELKWLVQDQVFDRQEIDSYLEKGIIIGKKILAQGSANGAIMIAQLRESQLWQSIFD